MTYTRRSMVVTEDAMEILDLVVLGWIVSMRDIERKDSGGSHGVPSF